MSRVELMSRVRVQVRDALELVLLPGLAALLPWPFCFRAFRFIAARSPWLYRDTCERALREAHARGHVPDAHQGQWLLRRRLLTLVDHADLYLAETRSGRWMERHLQVQGVWPTPSTAGIFCTFHWGAGMWGLKHAGAQGMHAHALVAALEGTQFAGRPILHWYARRRTRMVAKALQGPTLDVSASLAPVLRALRNGEQVMAAIDVPSDQVAASIPVQLLGIQTHVPKGLMRIAIEKGVPVTVYLTGLDFTTGQRFMKIAALGVHENIDTLAQAIFGHLDEAIATDSAAWHFWSEAPRFFGPPSR